MNADTVIPWSTTARGVAVPIESGVPAYRPARKSIVAHLERYSMDGMNHLSLLRLLANKNHVHVVSFFVSRLENLDAGTGLGASIIFRCQPGMLLIGNSSTVCQIDGRWRYPMPECLGKLSAALLCPLKMIDIESIELFIFTKQRHVLFQQSPRVP